MHGKEWGARIKLKCNVKEEKLEAKKLKMAQEEKVNIPQKLKTQSYVIGQGEIHVREQERAEGVGNIEKNVEGRRKKAIRNSTTPWKYKLAFGFKEFERKQP